STICHAMEVLVGVPPLHVSHSFVAVHHHRSPFVELPAPKTYPRPYHLRRQAEWIDQSGWAALHIQVEIWPFKIESRWIFANKPAAVRVVVPHPVVIDSRLLIELTPGELEWIGERSG